LSDGRVTALDFPEVTRPACVLYNRKAKLIYWVEIESRGSQIKQATLKGENTTVLMEAGYQNIKYIHRNKSHNCQIYEVSNGK
jgi:hypothetical protein